MAGFDTISNAMLTQFKTDVYMLARQKSSIFLPLVDVTQVGGKPGERVVFQRLGKTTASEVTDRYQELEANALPHSSRSLTLRHFHTHATLDTLDDMRMVFDPSGPYVNAMAMALGQKMDEVIFAAITGSADNKDGSSSTAFDTTNQLYDASSAVDVADLLTVRRKFNDAFVMPGEEIFAVIEGIAYSDLLQIDKITNAFYVNNKPLMDGMLGQFLDFQFKYYANMPQFNSVPTYQSLFFTRKGIKVALPVDVKMSIDRIPERRNSLLIQAEFVMGAVRMEENQVVQMKYTG